MSRAPTSRDPCEHEVLGNAKAVLFVRKPAHKKHQGAHEAACSVATFAAGSAIVGNLELDLFGNVWSPKQRRELIALKPVAQMQGLVRE